ncbi:MAG TPA: DHA2 family efflux MFS transporter permease subunit [Streptosporangiaceae bacterium]|nr:DHA2 family efflux MFS transporter permease subunit [Streptosporangiaceae bacterium]
MRLVRWRPRQEPVVVIVYMVGLYMTVVDSTIVFTALPSVARDFHESLAAAQWVTLSYLLSLAVFVPSSGWIGDRFGTRRTYLVALALFTGASALCGLAGSLTGLIIFRALQGVGGGLIVPVGQAMLFRTFPPERRARAAGLVALGISLGPATGPVLGGVLVTELSWRWCFYVNVPLGIVALAVGLLFLAEHREPAAGRLDVAGFLLAGAGLALFLYAISEAPVRGWGSPVIIATGAAGVAALAALAVTELRTRVPMLNLRLLRNRIFRSTSLVFLLSQCGYTGYLFIMPEFLQQARGASALSSGLTTLPGAIGLWTSSQVAARVYPRAGPRRMAVLGLAGVTVIFCLFGLTTGLATSAWLIRGLAFCSGSAIAWCIIAVQAASFSTISPADTGRASALFNTGAQAAGGIGVAVLVTVVSSAGRAGGRGAALVPAFHHAFLAAAALVVASGLIALTIRDSDAAASRAADDRVTGHPREHHRSGWFGT